MSSDMFLSSSFELLLFLPHKLLLIPPSKLFLVPPPRQLLATEALLLATKPGVEIEANAPSKEIASGASSTGWGLVHLLLLWLHISLVLMTEQAFRSFKTLSLLEMSTQLLYLLESIVVNSSVVA